LNGTDRVQGSIRSISSRRRSGLSSIALLLSSLVTMSAIMLLIIYLLFSSRIDFTRVILLGLIAAVLTPTLFTSTREILKNTIRKVIHKGPSRGDIVELDMGGMHYFVAGEEKDVLVITGNGTCWGRGFLILSKSLPQIETATNRNRIEDQKMLDVFIESAYSNKLPVQSVMSLNPIDEDDVMSDAQDLLNVPSDMIAGMDENRQLSMIHSRLGVWKSRMIMSTRSAAKPPSRISEVVEEVHTKLLQLKALFNAAFPDYLVEKAAGRREMKKIATFMLTHSEGSNLIRDGGGTTTLSGKELTKFMSIPHLISPIPDSFPYKEFQLNPLLESNVFLGTLLDDAGCPIAQTGLKTSHLREGIAVFAQNQDELDLTNKTIVSKLATTSTPYVVFTRDTKYRPLMSLIPDAVVIQLGEHFTINPLDAEDANAEQYIPLILTVFENSFPLTDEQANMLFTILHDVYAEEKTPTLSMLREHAQDIADGAKESLSRMRILEGVMKTLTMLLTGNAGEALTGTSTMQFKNLIEGASPLLIIEFTGITDPTVIRFIEGMILAKLYALYAARNDSAKLYGERMLLLEEADILFKSAILKYVRRAVPPAETMSKWVQELSKYGVGLHISTRSPSQVDDYILTRIGTKITHRITTFDEATIASKQMNLELQNTTRKYRSSVMPIIATLPPGDALLIRPDVKKPFPVRIMHEGVSELPSPDDSEVKRRMRQILPPGDTNLKKPTTQLQIDYADEQDRRIVKEILEILEEYTDFGKGTIMSSFDADEKQKVKGLLPKLENYRYIISTNIEISEGRLRRVYRLTEKGKKALEEESAAETRVTSADTYGPQEQSEIPETAVEMRNTIKVDSHLRPIFMGAVGGLRMARKLFKAAKFALALRRINQTLTEFLSSIAKNQRISIDLEQEDNLEEILSSLSYSGLSFPPGKSEITWISERAIESTDGEAPVAKEEALKALQQAVSFLKQTAAIYHIE
jgi:DNA-binding PadR family transcriptional regulator